MYKERIVIEEEFHRNFNERYRRACNIKKLKNKKRIKEMFGFKLKCKR
jgi:hypothetical protein